MLEQELVGAIRLEMTKRVLELRDKDDETSRKIADELDRWADRLRTIDTRRRMGWYG